jgi:hypothetical protein
MMYGCKQKGANEKRVRDWGSDVCASDQNGEMKNGGMKNGEMKNGGMKNGGMKNGGMKNGGMKNAKNLSKKKWLQLKTRVSWNTYIDRRKQANKIFTQKKKKWLNNKMTQIEETHRRNDSKTFFEGRQNYKQQAIHPIICKGAKDNVISQPDLILERWKDNFCKNLNISVGTDTQTIIREGTNTQPQIPLSSYNEICFIINNLKLNDAAGSDNIPPELLKH